MQTVFSCKTTDGERESLTFSMLFLLLSTRSFPIANNFVHDTPELLFVAACAWLREPHRRLFHHCCWATLDTAHYRLSSRVRSARESKTTLKLNIFFARALVDYQIAHSPSFMNYEAATRRRALASRKVRQKQNVNSLSRKNAKKKQPAVSKRIWDIVWSSLVWPYIHRISEIVSINSEELRSREHSQRYGERRDVECFFAN